MRNAPPSQTTSAKILIVDDHPMVAATLARVLKKLDIPLEIMTAKSGEEALAIIKRSNIDILITDFMMPGMNGLDLVSKIRGQYGTPYTILITAYDAPGLEITARQLNIKDYLVKPINPKKVCSIVNDVLTGIRAPASLETQPRAKPRILIADDFPDNVRLLSVRLRNEGYEFITAYDGLEAWKKIKAEQPDLVLLDVNMPKLDGFEVLGKIRNDTATQHIPVIVLTAARIGTRDVLKGLNLGADDYVTKPIDWQELSARIRTKLRVKHAGDHLRQQTHQWELLPKIGQALSALLDFDDLAEVVLTRTVQALEASSAHLIVFRPGGKVAYKFHASDSGQPANWNEIKHKLIREGLVFEVIGKGEPITVKNTKAYSGWVHIPGVPASSALSVPLLSHRGVIGVLTLNHNAQGYFNKDHLALAQAISSQAAIAIENAQFYTIERKRVTALVTLNQITHTISHFTHSTELFEELPGLIKEALHYQIVSLWLLENRTPILRSQQGMKGDATIETLKPSIETVVQTGQPNIFSPQPTAQEKESSTNGLKQPLQTVAVPFGRNGAVLGVLAIHCVEAPNAFHESDWMLMEALATQIGTSLERMHLFESLAREKQRLAAVLNAADDAILLIDGQDCLQLANPAGEQLFTDVDARIGQPLPKNVGYDAILELLDQARRTNAAVRAELPWPDKRTFAATITPIEKSGLVALLHDVSHFKDLERIKNEFIATATHDLKNPINAVLGYSDLMEMVGPLSDKQAEFVRHMRRASGQMYELVLNLLELSQMELEPKPTQKPCNTRELLEGIAFEFQTQAKMKEQTIHLVLPAELPFIQAGEDRVKQVLRNLVGNAIKYSPAGGETTISAQIEGQGLRINVRDTGYGIPDSELPHIFEKFYRVHTEDTEDIQGNGLGLPIVKTIIEQHGGQIDVESAQGEGSCFSFILPLALPSDAPPDASSEQTASPRPAAALAPAK